MSRPREIRIVRREGTPRQQRRRAARETAAAERAAQRARFAEDLRRTTQ